VFQLDAPQESVVGGIGDAGAAFGKILVFSAVNVVVLDVGLILIFSEIVFSDEIHVEQHGASAVNVAQDFVKHAVIDNGDVAEHAVIVLNVQAPFFCLGRNVHLRVAENFSVEHAQEFTGAKQEVVIAAVAHNFFDKSLELGASERRTHVFAHGQIFQDAAASSAGSISVILFLASDECAFFGFHVIPETFLFLLIQVSFMRS